MLCVEVHAYLKLMKMDSFFILQKENSLKKLHASAPRLQRTCSDESLYGGNMKAERAAYLDAIGSDVIFTTAVPAQVVNTTPPTSASANYLNVANK